MKTKKHGNASVVRYSNRKLYELASSRYVTLDDAVSGIVSLPDYVVRDAVTGSDITRETFLKWLSTYEAQQLPNHVLANMLRGLDRDVA